MDNNTRAQQIFNQNQPMDRETAYSTVTREIDQALASMFPHGSGTTTQHRVQHHLEHVAQVAFTTGANYALTSLLTVEDVADQLHITPRRVRAIARVQHQRAAIGWQVPGTNQWLFRPEEIEHLRPGPVGRPPKA